MNRRRTQEELSETSQNDEDDTDDDVNIPVLKRKRMVLNAVVV